jgi:hypothetical protein
VPAYFGGRCITAQPQRRCTLKLHRQVIGLPKNSALGYRGLCMNTCITGGGLRRPGRGHLIKIPDTPKDSKRAFTPRKQRFSTPVDIRWVGQGVRPGHENWWPTATTYWSTTYWRMRPSESCVSCMPHVCGRLQANTCLKFGKCAKKHCAGADQWDGRPHP